MNLRLLCIIFSQLYYYYYHYSNKTDYKSYNYEVLSL